MADKKKLSIHELAQMKREGRKIAWLTAYDYPTARFAESAGLDLLLVGDSLGMCVYGYEGTVPVTMDQCIVHCQAVRRGAPNTFVIGDMPFMSYQKSDEDAVVNAGRFLKEAMVDAVKLEGGRRVITRIKAILDAGMVVCGHIGLTPQSSGQLGGHKAQGRTVESARAVIEDALAIEEAGAQLLLLEAVPPEVAAFITRRLAHARVQHRRGPGLRRAAADRLGPDRAVPGLHPQVREEVRGRGRGGHRRHEGLRGGREAGHFPGRRALLPHAGGPGSGVPGAHPEVREMSAGLEAPPAGCGAGCASKPAACAS